MKNIATIQTTKYILDKYHLNALKKYGQNFLIDINIVEKIVDQANINDETLVIEVGPGIGALTQILAKYAKKVISYEIDERFKPVHEEFLDCDNIEIKYENFLDSDLSNFDGTYQKVVLVANLPYYITSDILEHVTSSDSLISEMYVMVQKEVASKFTSEYKSPLSLLIEDRGYSEYLFTVSKNVFIPAPHVDSAILKIVFSKEYNPKLHSLLKDSFTQKRKTIYNNLKEYPNIIDILDKCSIDKSKRAQELTIEDYRNITKYL